MCELTGYQTEDEKDNGNFKNGLIFEGKTGKITFANSCVLYVSWRR
jgi:hypothetical protein